MRTVNLNLILLAATVFLTCCSVKDDGAVQDILFELDEAGYVVSASGGDVRVGYVCKNIPEGAEPAVVYEADWISGYDVSVAGVIVLSVEENVDTSARSCDVDVTLANVKRTFSLTQEGVSDRTPDDGEEVFNITVKSVGEASVAVSVESFIEDTYLIMAMEKSEWDAAGSEDEVFVTVVEAFMRQAKEWGYSLDGFLTDMQLLTRGSVGEKVIELLSPDTDHVIFAVGMSLAGEKTSKMSYEEFHTEPVRWSDVSFEIRYDVEKISGTMTVSPSDPEQQYYYNLLSVTDINSYGLPLVDVMQDFITEWIEFYAGYMSTADILKDLCNTGEQIFVLDGHINADTEYCGFAFSVSESGYINSDVAEKNFKTGIPDPSDNIIQLSIPIKTDTYAAWSTTVSNGDPYTVVVLPSSETDGLDSEEIASWILSSDKDITVYNGSTSEELNNLTPGTEYYAVAFGVEGMYPTTGVTVVPFYTTSDSEGFATLSISVDSLGGNTVYYSITAAPESSAYFHGVAPHDYSAEEVIELVQAYADATMGWGVICTIASSTGSYSTSRNFMYNTSGGNDYLESGETYKVYAFGVSTMDYSYDENVTFSDTFMIE